MRYLPVSLSSIYILIVSPRDLVIFDKSVVMEMIK